MMPSVCDLLMPALSKRIDDAIPVVGAQAVFGVIGSALGATLGSGASGGGWEYLRRAVSTLDTPLPRVLVAGWRRYEELLAFAAAPGRPASSGEVDLWRYETKGFWKLSTRFPDVGVRGPSLAVTLSLALDAATIIIRTGRFAAVDAASMRYEADLRVDGAPDDILHIGPVHHALPDGRIDFGRGWPVRPGLAG